MKHWRFMDYHDQGGVNLIKEWYRKQGPELQAAFTFAVQEIAVTEDLSTLSSFIRLTNRHIGLFEIRIQTIEARSKKRQFRPVGFWSLNPNELILVDGCEKSGRVTIPVGVFDAALDIQLEYYRDGKGTIYEHF